MLATSSQPLLDPDVVAGGYGHLRNYVGSWDSIGSAVDGPSVSTKLMKCTSTHIAITASYGCDLTMEDCRVFGVIGAATGRTEHDQGHGVQAKGYFIATRCTFEDNYFAGLKLKEAYAELVDYHFLNNGRDGLQVSSGEVELRGGTIIGHLSMLRRSF